MDKDKLIEFFTVLAVALVAGAAAWGAVTYLKEPLKTIALFVIVGTILLLWQLLRKKFGRTRE